MKLVHRFCLVLGVATALASCTGDGGGVATGDQTGPVTFTASATDSGTSSTTTDGSTTTGSDSDSDSATSTTGPTTATTGSETSGTTDPGPCGNGVEDGNETDVDCGGPECDMCGLGKGCLIDTDCMTGNCANDLVCRPPECDDLKMNGDETDIDCGGPDCMPCADDLMCTVGTDCVSGVCESGICTGPACDDGIMNQDETDVDCGGEVCGGCADGLDCSIHDDCAALLCVSGTCETIACATNADCGAVGADCEQGICDTQTNTCTVMDIPNNNPCNLADPCMSGTCFNGTCSGIGPTDCSYLNGPCATGVCDAVMGCQAQAMADNMPCDDGSVCTQNSICTAGVCQPGTATDCSYLDTPCQAGSCNAITGVCQSTAMADGTACDDGFACSTNDQCLSGQCLGGGLTPLWDEDFEGNTNGWTLGTEWAIGPAMVSTCGIYGNEDPGTDHTAGNGNNIAGVVLGGCAATTIHADYCLESPPIDTSGVNGPLILEFFRWLNSDYTPYMQNSVHVWDGNAWLSLWATGSSPGIQDADWTQIDFDVANFKNADFKVRWCFSIGSGGVFTVSQWNLDDVALLTCN